MRRTLVARALADFGSESPRLYPVLALAQEDAAKLGAMLLLALVLIDLVPGRVRVGMSAGRGALFLRLRRGHVLVVIAVLVGGLTPLTCSRPARAGGSSGAAGAAPLPTYPVYFLHHDHLGSTSLGTCYKRPAAENCPDGAVKRYFRYDGYGLVRAFSETGATLDHNNLTALLIDRLYTGQRWEPAARVYDYHARFYEPRIARFVSHDPAREFTNPYSLVNWRPMRLVDPTGAMGVYPPNFTPAFTAVRGPVPYYDLNAALQGGLDNGQTFTANGTTIDPGALASWSGNIANGFNWASNYNVAGSGNFVAQILLGVIGLATVVALMIGAPFLLSLTLAGAFVGGVAGALMGGGDAGAIYAGMGMGAMAGGSVAAVPAAAAEGLGVVAVAGANGAASAGVNAALQFITTGSVDVDSVVVAGAMGVAWGLVGGGIAANGNDVVGGMASALLDLSMTIVGSTLSKQQSSVLSSLSDARVTVTHTIHSQAAVDTQ